MYACDINKCYINVNGQNPAYVTVEKVIIYYPVIHFIYGKVKANFGLEQTMKARRGSRSILLLFFNLRARWEWVVNVRSEIISQIGSVVKLIKV
jgi:hypothetical protein